MPAQYPSGITLISLIITIIVMLILAGVTLSMTLGENGIFNQSKLAIEKYENSRIKEEQELQNTANEILNLGVVSNRDDSLVTLTQDQYNRLLAYQPGDELNYDRHIDLGFITRSCKRVCFTIDLAKEISSNVRDIEISSYKFSIRDVSGNYLVVPINTTTWDVDPANIGDYFTVVSYSENSIMLSYDSNTALSTTNNAPFSILIENLKIKFK